MLWTIVLKSIVESETRRDKDYGKINDEAYDNNNRNPCKLVETKKKISHFQS